MLSRIGISTLRSRNIRSGLVQTVVHSRTKMNMVFNFVPQQEEWLVERFGGYVRTCKPGLNIVLPVIEQIAYTRQLKESTIVISPQHCITRDNVQVKLDGTVYYQVIDSYKSCYGVKDPEYAVEMLAQSVMRKEVGKLDLDELFHRRDSINSSIISALHEATVPWGIDIKRYEIQDIHTDAATTESMHRQSAAERQKRADILKSEGYLQTKINESEGEKMEKINQAKAEAERVRLHADAQAHNTRVSAEATAYGIKLRAHATSEGLKIVGEALVTEEGNSAMAQQLASQYIEKLPEMFDKANTIVVPQEPTNVAGVLTTGLSIVKEVLEKHKKT
eukprot:Lithocolla_globosa_v1_NODE_5327_length_1260_cov_8.932780.p1 type:complete len:334 gc:universal NODE_5327_length_1260_cov_8.932780:69-1070(+)